MTKTKLSYLEESLSLWPPTKIRCYWNYLQITYLWCNQT